MLLLDEPLSNLDKGLRGRMRDEIREVQQRLGITTVFVTHDQDEALAISDDVVVMNTGNVVERGLPQAIYTSPQDEFTARFLGLSNNLRGVVESAGRNGALVNCGKRTLLCRALGNAAPGDEVSVFMRPESFRLSRRQHSEDAVAGHGGVLASTTATAGTTTSGSTSDVLKVRVYQEKIGLAHGDAVFLEPDPDSTIVITGNRSLAGSDEPVPDPAEV